MKRELRNGDLVYVKAENLNRTYEHYDERGLIGIVVDDIDAHEEVQVYHCSFPVRFQWWNSDDVVLLSGCNNLSYLERGRNETR